MQMSVQHKIFFEAINSLAPTYLQIFWKSNSVRRFLILERLCFGIHCSFLVFKRIEIETYFLTDPLVITCQQCHVILPRWCHQQPSYYSQINWCLGVLHYPNLVILALVRMEFNQSYVILEQWRCPSNPAVQTWWQQPLLKMEL